jgi:hypothetical protein
MTARVLVGLLTDYVRRHPKTSAMIAFNLGLYAASATKGLRRSDLTELPSRLVELVPSMKDLAGHFSPPPVARKRRHRAARKPAARRARRAA